MGKRGPAPTPTAILSARGSWRAGERAGEPQLPPGEPECPATLEGEAREIWHQAVAVLLKMRVLTEADLSTLEPYARFYAEYREMQRRCDKMLKKVKGEFPNYPQVFALRNSAFDRMTKEAAKLGFSPADRARLKAQAPETPDEGKGRFFKGRSA